MDDLVINVVLGLMFGALCVVVVLVLTVVTAMAVDLVGPPGLLALLPPIIGVAWGVWDWRKDGGTL